MSWGRRGRYDGGGWPRYVPVAERREKARKEAEKLGKKGESLSPVVIAGRTIAATFWGKAWCRNLEQYSDYANRIPRGRAYVRNGSVLDLKISAGRVDALVSGTRLYKVAIEIRPLQPPNWKDIKGACTGRIGSLLELLQGKLSREVMEVVTRPRTGLFPEPAEISFQCSCPDWASMCKHVAAVLYGVGARLDREPELLFRLRDVDQRELIAAPETVGVAASAGIGDRVIADEELAGIFGIEIDAGRAARRSAPARQATPKRGSGQETRTGPPETPALKGTRRPAPATPAATIEPARPRRGRPPKTAAPVATPEPPKRKPGRPRLPVKTGAAAPAVSLPAEAKRKRSPLSGEKLSVSVKKKPRSPKGMRESLPHPPEMPEPTPRRRGRPPKAASPVATPESPKRKPGRPPGKGRA